MNAKREPLLTEIRGVPETKDTCNRWLVVALQNLVVAATANGCKVHSGYLLIAGLKYRDKIELGGSLFNAERTEDWSPTHG